MTLLTLLTLTLLRSHLPVVRVGNWGVQPVPSRLRDPPWRPPPGDLWRLSGRKLSVEGMPFAGVAITGDLCPCSRIRGDMSIVVVSRRGTLLHSISKPLLSLTPSSPFSRESGFLYAPMRRGGPPLVGSDSSPSPDPALRRIWKSSLKYGTF